MEIPHDFSLSPLEIPFPCLEITNNTKLKIDSNDPRKNLVCSLFEADAHDASDMNKRSISNNIKKLNTNFLYILVLQLSLMDYSRKNLNKGGG